MKPNIKFIEREMTDSELKLMNKGFDKHLAKFDNPPLKQKRFTIIIMDNNKFIGSASGLTNDNKEWFYLTDLFINEEYRKQGLGAKALKQLEDKVKKIGIKHIWTWTAGFEAPHFYKKQGYKVFTEMKDWYKSGHSRFGFLKDI
jgi:N-acetylglutamate synthase-like GNAT family acetyltransferase